MTSSDPTQGVLYQNRLRQNQSQKLPEKCLIWKEKGKIQKNREVGKTKSSFVTIPKRIRAINLRERLLKALDIGSRTTKHPPSNSPNGRVGPSKPSYSSNGRVGPTTPFNSLIWRDGPIMPSNSSNEQVGPTTPSNSPIWLVGPTKLPSSHPRSSLSCDQIELALVSSRSRSPSELYSLGNHKNSFSRRKFRLIV